MTGLALSAAFLVMMERRGKRAYAENPARALAARAVAPARPDAAEAFSMASGA